MPTAVPSGFKNKYGDRYFNRLPYTGAPIDRKEDDPEYRQPVEGSSVNIRQFDTTKAEDVEEWSKIMQKVADGMANVSFEEKVYDPDIKGWRVLIRWVDYFYTNPEVV